MSAKGYAVLDSKGKIMVHTVSETERSAKVNWLHINGGCRVLDSWTNKTIDVMFERLRGTRELVEVEIRIKRH